jgi:ABC-type sugar transport system ATPase subunit
VATVELKKVSKRFGPVEVIRNVDLRIEDGSFCVFVGPSGCGKSTLLRMIAGLEHTSSGSIQIGGVEMVDVPPARRSVAMVFQSYALYPHMTISENITFGLRMASTVPDVIKRKLNAASQILKLGTLLDRKPSQLSGGQRQRVAIGRAIVRAGSLSV